MDSGSYVVNNDNYKQAVKRLKSVRKAWIICSAPDHQKSSLDKHIIGNNLK